MHALSAFNSVRHRKRSRRAFATHDLRSQAFGKKAAMSEAGRRRLTMAEIPERLKATEIVASVWQSMMHTTGLAEFSAMNDIAVDQCARRIAAEARIRELEQERD